MEYNINFQKEKLNWPKCAGVYTFWFKNTPIYIGKSINLKARLLSYFQKDVNIKTHQMVTNADKVTFIKVTSELEALLLEAYLVKKHKPKYNILLKDDKHALYIVITKEQFPRVLAVRKLVSNQYSLKNTFGPFPNSSMVAKILKNIRKVLPYSDHKIGKRVCFYNHLGLCNPCPNTISSNEDIKLYRKNIRNIRLILSRKFNKVRNSLEKEMLIKSKEEDFEKAKELRDKLKIFDYITQEKTKETDFILNPNIVEDKINEQLHKLELLLKISPIKRIECFDIAHLQGAYATASMVVFVDGVKSEKDYRHFKINQENKQSDYDSMREIAQRRIKHIDDWGKPDVIIVDGGLGQLNVFNEFYSKLNIPIFGIAKNPDRLIFVNGNKINLRKYNISLLSQIRDEAHRFARRYHHKLISKSLFT